MKRLFLLFATFVVFVGLQAQVTYTDIDNFESGSTNVTVLWSGASSVVDNTTGTTGSKVLQVTDEAGSPFVNIPVTFESGKTWTDYDGIEMSIYPKTNTVESSSAKAIGVDLSLLKAYENAGVTYKDASGNTISDIIPWLGNNKGVNYVRIRLFVDPTNSYAQTLAGGSSYLNQLGGDLATVKVLGKRVKDAGMKFLLDIQYSDGWADPAKQVMPYSWTSTCNTQAKLQQKVYDYTKDVLTQLVAYGATPDMVQIGNEITYGMFFTNYDSPTSKYTNGSNSINYNTTSAGSAGVHCFVTYWSSSTYSGDTYWGNLCNVINKGSQAVREVCPNAKIMLHTERSAYTTKCTASGYTTYYMAQMFYKKMQDHSVDYDVIGLSYYPEDHGVLNNLNTILTSLEGSFPTKEIMLAEYGYSNNWARGSNTPGTIGYYKKGDQSSSCPLSQKEFISALITQLKNHSKVTGMFYWFAEENEATSSGPYGNGWRNSGLWANESTNVASNLTNSKYNQAAGCALPAVDVLADFQTAGAETSKSAYYAQTWLKFYDADGAASWMHKKVGLNVDDEWGVDFATNGLGSWYTVKFGFNADSIADYISAVGSAPSSINLELRNYTNPSETNNDFYLDNVRFYKTVYESYALDFEDGTINSPSSAVSDAWCTGSQKVKANPSKSGINTSDKVMTVTNTWVEGCDLYTWSVPLPDNLSLYDSIYIDVYPTTGTSYLTLQFDAADDAAWTKLYDGATITNWTANAWNRLKIALSSLSDLTATHMYFGMWESGYSIDNITFHAIETAASEYTVTWNATTNGGTCATATTTVTAGNAIGTLPTATKTGATFNGWFTAATGGTQITAATVPTGDVTYYAQFTPNKYAITWKDGDNNTLKTDQVDYGTVPVYSGATPTKTATAQYTYTFNNTWSPTPVAVTAAATYTAQFSSTVNTYTISFNANGHGTAPSSQTVAYGSKVTNPGNLSETGWTFGGWYKEAACTNAWNFNSMTVTGAQTLYAKWTANTNTAYTVRHQWQNIDDNYYTLHESEAKTGTTAQQTAATAKTYTGFTAQSFSQKTIAADGSTVVDIYYDRKTYTVTWKNADGTTLETDNNVRYGATPSYDGATPTKAATAQYTYTFASWTPAVEAVSANATYTATFSQTVNQYTLTVNGATGSGTYDYGTSVTLTPTPADNYHFTQWSDGNTDNPRTVTVTANATYTAQSEEDTKTTVYLFPTVWDVDNAKFAAYVFEDGKAAAWSPLMTKTADGKAYTAQVYDYAKIIFVRLKNTASSGNWDDKWNQTADLNRSASYNCYQITGWGDTDGRWRNYPFYFVDFRDHDATLLKTDTVDSGLAATAPANPSRVGYTFSGWDNLFNNVTADLTVTAQYTANTNTAYTVRHQWQNLDDNDYTLHESETKYGTTAQQTAATAKSYTGFTAKSFSQATIAADGSTVVDIYYDRQTFTITWKNGDNQTIETDQNVRYGATPTYDGATPTKTSTAQYTYTFNNTWSPAIATVTANATYTAQFDQTVNSYTITYLDDNNQEISHETLNYGVMPAPATPTKAATVQYTYTFNQWVPALATVTGDATYRATFNSTVNSYTITFYDEDGTTILKQSTLDYGMAITAPANPTKEGDAQYSYTFAGWTPALADGATVTGEASYKAVYTQSVNQYTITALATPAAGGSVAGAGTYDYSTSVTLTATAAEHYHFVQWSDGVSTATRTVTVTADATYTAEFAKDRFTITVSAVNGTVSGGGEYDYGTEIQLLATGNTGYTFSQWSDGITDNPRTVVVTANASYTAQFSTVAYSITKEVEGNGSIHGEDGGNINDVITLTAVADYGWEFVRWEDNSTNAVRQLTITGDMTVKAFFQRRTFTLTTKVNDTAMGSVTAGGSYLYEAEVSITATAQPNHHFVGWSDAAAEGATRTITILSDTTVTANFAIDQFTLTVTANDASMGTVTGAGTYNYGETAHLEATPTEGYHFVGWEPTSLGTESSVDVTVDGTVTTITAVFAINTYTVRFLVDGVEYDVQTVNHGSSAVAPTAPTKTGFTFTGWDKSLNNITANTDINAVFVPSGDTKYTVRHQWQNIADNFYTLHESELLYGTTDAPTSAIAKTYTGFTAQTVVQKTIAADGSTVVDIYYDRQTFEIEFVVDEEAIQTDNLRYGAMPVAPADPTKPADEQYTYTFDHWTPEIAVVTGNATYTALFSTTLNKYLVEFYNWNSVLLQSSEWEYGTTPVYSGPQPTREDDHQYTYTFAGWDPQIEPVTEEAFYFATFSSQLRTFSANDVVTSNDPDMGSVAISPQQNEYEYGEQITVTATPQQGYEFSGWQNEDDEIISTDATTTITVTDSTLTAIFEPSTNTRYLVHHLQQNLNDDLYTLVETDTLYGTTGRLTQVETVRRNYPGFYIKYCENVPIAADGSTELNALYDRLTYSVRWVVEDAERLDTLRYGAMPDYGSVPTKAATAQYTYTFAGWDPEVVTVTADATYRAVFSSEVNRYTVTFHANGHATDPEPASVEYGHIVNCTTLYADDGWIFDGWFREAGCQTPWDCLQDVVTADIDLYAKWIPSENMFYWVNYWQQNIYDDDYTLVEFEQIKGTTGQMTQAVAKDYTGFVMKPFSQVPIAPNTEVNIYYDRLRYEVNFVVEGVVVQSDSVRYYGSAEYRGETPTKPETEQFYYTFWCWDKATNMPIVADVTFTALFNEYSKGGGTGLESIVITESGISGPKGMRVYDLTGKDVTNAMDHLYQGSYIIVLDGKTKKVMIP